MKRTQPTHIVMFSLEVFAAKAAKGIKKGNHILQKKFPGIPVPAARSKIFSLDGLEELDLLLAAGEMELCEHEGVMRYAFSLHPAGWSKKHVPEVSAALIKKALRKGWSIFS